ncbi:MAG: cytochrome c [Bdellovibrionales bacterium]|nr:cytochrome c [Bdellovibrionales bacterium]
MVAFKQLIKILAVTLPLGGVIFFLSNQTLNSAITFESIESKTITEHSVYNQVTFESEGDQDIWKMRQSHQGRNLKLKQWDELLIKVDKSSRPFKVSYLQLQDGKEVEFKVSCYFCHSNGPRAIRPKSGSLLAPLTYTERIQIAFMNFRIKTYGKMIIQKENLKLGNQERITPLKYFGKNELAPLEVAACTMCHHDQFWGRGSLTRQQALPIQHLIKKGQMPPWPLTLSPEDKQQIESYLQGF